MLAEGAPQVLHRGRSPHRVETTESDTPHEFERRGTLRGDEALLEGAVHIGAAPAEFAIAVGLGAAGELRDRFGRAIDVRVQIEPAAFEPGMAREDAGRRQVEAPLQ